MENSSRIDEILFVSQYFVVLCNLCPPVRLRVSKKLYPKTFSSSKARTDNETGRNK